jgi:hypothetical protein
MRGPSGGQSVRVRICPSCNHPNPEDRIDCEILHVYLTMENLGRLLKAPKISRH